MAVFNSRIVRRVELAALRIGVLSLKHARGQIDADAVRREGNNHLADLKTALEMSRTEIHTNLTTALKEYFDPQGGRFQERVERLIRQDGDLEQVLRRQIGSDGSELTRTLAEHIGENSPLMKLLNPEESDGLVLELFGELPWRLSLLAVVDVSSCSLLRQNENLPPAVGESKRKPSVHVA
jgi:hypothetical protein